MLRLAQVSGRFTTAILIGYSGRDLDVFPWLVTDAGISEYYWIDKEFGEGHRSGEITDCKQIQGPCENLATSVLRAWAANGDTEQPFRWRRRCGVGWAR